VGLSSETRLWKALFIVISFSLPADILLAQIPKGVLLKTSLRMRKCYKHSNLFAI
jgi:hypothetical protein